MIANENGFYALTAPEFATQCEAVNALPRLCTVAEANAPEAVGLRAWPSGLLPWGASGEIQALAWPDGRCMVSEAIFKAMGGQID